MLHVMSGKPVKHQLENPFTHVSILQVWRKTKFGADFVTPRSIPLPPISWARQAKLDSQRLSLSWHLTSLAGGRVWPVTMSPLCWHHDTLFVLPCDHIGHGMWPVRQVPLPPIGTAETETGGTVPSNSFTSVCAPLCVCMCERMCVSQSVCDCVCTAETETGGTVPPAAAACVCDPAWEKQTNTEHNFLSPAKWDFEMLLFFRLLLPKCSGGKKVVWSESPLTTPF